VGTTLKTILVIDDDPFIRAMLRQAFEEKSFRVVEARDGDEGLDVFGAEEVDLVITDIIMPGKEGLSTIRDLLKASNGLKVIAMSGGGMTGNDYLPMAVDLGVRHTFVKPFPMNEMTSAVDDLIG
jgi:DNA-binding response OmpR family regulator